jgi:hypothetical protein
VRNPNLESLRCRSRVLLRRGVSIPNIELGGEGGTSAASGEVTMEESLSQPRLSEARL